MRAIISSTWDNKYLYFMPIVSYCWQKLGVETICFMPRPKDEKLTDYKVVFGDNPASRMITDPRYSLIINTIHKFDGKLDIKFFDAPEHKEATYAQCSRLYGACLDLPADEILITGDVDMAMFQIPPYIDKITIFGSDLVPEGQFPMCYASGTVKEWRIAMKLQYGSLSEKPENSLMQLNVKTYQQCLDELLGEIEADHFRGNYWGKDQQTLWENVKDNATLIPRARPNTQFAANRVDREDINWRSYVNDELVDAHLWRNGFEDSNFQNIMELLKMKYPEENFQWLTDYNEAYKKLL